MVFVSLEKKVMNKLEVEIIPSHHPIFLGRLIPPQRWCYTERSDHNWRLGLWLDDLLCEVYSTPGGYGSWKGLSNPLMHGDPGFAISERMSHRCEVRHGLCRPTNRHVTGVKRTKGERFHTSVNYYLMTDLIKWNVVSGWRNANTDSVYPLLGTSERIQVVWSEIYDSVILVGCLRAGDGNK